MARDAGTVGADVPDLATTDYDSDVDEYGHCYTRRAQPARQHLHGFLHHAKHHASWIGAAVCSQRKEHTFKTSTSAQRRINNWPDRDRMPHRHLGVYCAVSAQVCRHLMAP